MTQAADLSRLTGEFHSGAAENAFRTTTFAEARQQIAWATGVAFALNVLFLGSDLFYANTAAFSSLLSVRAGLIAVCLAAMLAALRLRDPAAAQRLVLLWLAALNLLVAATFAILPSNVALFVAYFLPAIYLVGLPIGFMPRMIAAAGTGALFLAVLMPARHEMGDNVLGLTLVMALVIAGCAVTARQSNRLRRIAFAALDVERAERDNLQQLLEMLPVPLVLARWSDGAILHANQQSRHLFGLSSADVWAGVDWQRLLELLGAGGRVGGLEARMRLADGRSCAMLVAATRLEVGGEACVLATATDIDARERMERALRFSEERHRAILDALSAGGLGLFMVDRTYRLRYLNRTLTDLYGAVAGEICYRRLADRDTPCGHCQLAVVIDDGKLTRQEVATATGKVFDVIAVPFVTEEGEPCKLEIVHDITERRCAEDALRRAHDELELRVAERTQSLSLEVAQREAAERRLLRAKEAAEMADRAKSEFLANMSHELRTPLNAIIGFSDVIEKEVFGPLGSSRYLEYMRYIHESGQHLLELINDILDIAAIEAGRVELSEEEVDPAVIVQASLRLVRPRAESGRIRLVDDLPSALPHLNADPRRLKQILINLLSNAVKFTPENGTVTISAARTADGGLALRVKDTGVGMTDAELAIALSTFGQVDSGLDRKREGTGLGLPLTRALVELHGGTLVLDSTPGAGTTASVILGPERVLATEPAWAPA